MYLNFSAMEWLKVTKIWKNRETLFILKNSLHFDEFFHEKFKWTISWKTRETLFAVKLQIVELALFWRILLQKIRIDKLMKKREKTFCRNVYFNPQSIVI